MTVKNRIYRQQKLNLNQQATPLRFAVTVIFLRYQIKFKNEFYKDTEFIKKKCKAVVDI